MSMDTLNERKTKKERKEEIRKRKKIRTKEKKKGSNQGSVFLTSTMAGVGEFLCGDTQVTEVELTQVPVTSAKSKEHLMVEEEEEPKLVPVTVT